MKSKQDIKSNAPIGATHYSRQVKRYFKIDKHKVYVFKFSNWFVHHGLEPEDTTPIGQNDYGYSN